MLRRDFNETEIRKETDEKGTTRYFDADGQLHRDDGPALVKQGLAAWYRHGQLHREGGPAIEADGDTAWYFTGKLHRTDGPAIEIPDVRDGSANEWWIDGQQLTAEEFVSAGPNAKRESDSQKPHPFS